MTNKTAYDSQGFLITKSRILKNALVLSLSFLFVFTAFTSLSFLQSTLNKEAGLGITGLAVIYVALIVSCMFFPSMLIDCLGCKWTIALSIICYILYMAANMYAVGYLMYPASVIIGLGAAPLWSAKCAYLTQIAVWYANLIGSLNEAIISRFFGIFFMFFQTSGIWGNIISSSILATELQNITSDQFLSCGKNFCPESQENNTNLDRPIETKVYIMVGCYIACAVVGFLVIVFFLDNMTLEPKPTDSQDQDHYRRRRLSFKLLAATFKHWWKSPAQKLIVPLTAYSGVEQAFIAGDYTKAYIGCSIGLWNVGYVMICYAVVDSISSLVCGKLVEHTGQLVFFIFGTVLHVSLSIALLVWIPDNKAFYLLYILAGLWGMGDAIWQTQINALYGKLFRKNAEAAFANYRLWESLGFAVTFAYSNYLCTDVKIYICVATLLVGMVGYLIIELRIKCRPTPVVMDANDADQL